MTTDEFVSAYATDAMCATHAGFLLAIGHYLPMHVNPHDERVLAVIERCKSIHRIDQPELPETD